MPGGDEDEKAKGPLIESLAMGSGVGRRVGKGAESGALRRLPGRRVAPMRWGDHQKGSGLSTAPNRGMFGFGPSAIW
jgi:hypothetical protein